MYEIWQLIKNKRFPNLQSWVKRRTMNCLLSIYNPEKVSMDEVQENLERDFCNSDCVHKYKVKSSRANMREPDIFNTK